PLDEQFRKRLERIFNGWQEGIATALRRGQSQGTVRRDLVPEETAGFLIAMYEGYVLLAKNAQDAKVWNVGIRNIVGWLRSLRAPRQTQGKTMNRRRLAMVACLSFTLILGLIGMEQGWAQGPKTAYPNMAQLDQYLMAVRNGEIALARSAAPDAISVDAKIL